MIRVAKWDVVSSTGRSFTVRPLTVRERLSISADVSDERARIAAQDATLAGMSKADAAEHIGSERRKAANTSTLYLDCYSLQGAIRVLSVSMGVDEALLFAEQVTPQTLTNTALECLGIDIEKAQSEKDDSPGN
jgi:hypothetical protein